MLPEVTLAHKGLAPSGIISHTNYVYSKIIRIFKLFNKLITGVHMLMLGTHRVDGPD